MTFDWSAFGIIIAAVGVVVTLTGYFSREINIVDTRQATAIKNVEEKSASAVKTVGEMALKDNERLEAVQDRARHDLANKTTVEFGQVWIELKSMRDEKANRADVAEMERRQLAMIASINTSVAKLDDKMGMLIEVQVISKSNAAMLEKILNRDFDYKHTSNKDA
jgi:hypothetical protein